MYSDFYGFQDRPFNLTPDPRFIFLSRNHREAIAHLLYGINNHVGFISLTGEVGSGKTTVLRTLLSHLESDQYRTALVFNPSLSPSGLLRSIGREFGIVSDLEDEADNDILDKLNRFLIRENAQKRTVVLVIDEAQNLGAKVLE
ncbi:MAG: AAA family ATPase, partial [Syntrophales bacterium]|nr:AAA family ATPase [Syntrophales bacterium]